MIAIELVRPGHASSPTPRWPRPWWPACAAAGVSRSAAAPTATCSGCCRRWSSTRRCSSRASTCSPSALRSASTLSDQPGAQAPVGTDAASSTLRGDRAADRAAPVERVADVGVDRRAGEDDAEDPASWADHRPARVAGQDDAPSARRPGGSPGRRRRCRGPMASNDAEIGRLAAHGDRRSRGSPTTAAGVPRRDQRAVQAPAAGRAGRWSGAQRRRGRGRPGRRWLDSPGRPTMTSASLDAGDDVGVGHDHARVRRRSREPSTSRRIPRRRP